MSSIENNPQKQFYSQRAIGIATFFGGPLAAGILVRRNYINLGNDLYGKHALSIGILSTLLLFTVIFSIPEHIIDKTPNSVVPAIYTLIIFLIVEKLQGGNLKKHKENNGTFYSAWKATGVGFFCMLVIVVGILGYVYSVGDHFDTEEYDRGLAEIQQNEEVALQLFNLGGDASINQIIDLINKKGIPNWEKNITILNRMDNIEGLTDEFKKQNEILRTYYKLRINSYELIQKATIEDTDIYANDIQRLEKEIDQEIAKLTTQ